MLVDGKAAAEAVAVSPSTIRVWVTRGHLTVAGRRGGANLYDLAEVYEAHRDLGSAHGDTSVVYYAERDGFVKIGTSTDVEQRMYRLGSRLLATEPGGVGKERERHAQFAAHRMRGEWFVPVPRLLALIEALRNVACNVPCNVRSFPADRPSDCHVASV